MTGPASGGSITWQLVDGTETYFVLSKALDDFAANPEYAEHAACADELRADLEAAMDRALAA